MQMALIILLTVFVVGAISVRYLGNDNAVEEISEQIAEDEIEQLLELKNNELKDKIDFSYGSKEK